MITIYFINTDSKVSGVNQRDFVDEQEAQNFFEKVPHYTRVSKFSPDFFLNEEGQVNEKGDYTLETLPIPCKVTIEGVTYDCHEQPTFEFSAPGRYMIQVDAGNAYLKKSFTYDYFPSSTEL